MINLIPQTAVPNAHFCENMLLYGSLEKGSHAARGFKIVPPCLRNAPYTIKNNYHDKLRKLLQSIGPRQGLQVQWSCGSDYKQELLAYDQQTRQCEYDSIRKTRNKKFKYFWGKMERKELRREELTLFPVLKIESYSGNFIGRKGLSQYYDRLIEGLKTHFQEVEHLYRMVLGEDTHIEAMTDAEHFAYVKKFLNPSLAEQEDYDFDTCFDPFRSLQENCLHSEGVESGHGLYFDGFYHTLFSITRWPAKTTPGIIHELTGLPFLNYRITQNIHPLPIQEEVDREEKKLERLQGEYATRSERRSHLTAIHKKEEKIDSLASGYIYPFEVEVIVRVWDETEVGLHAKSTAIKQAINNMNGAQHFECSIPTTAKKLFFNSWPGNHSNNNKFRRLYAEDTYFVDMMPFSATFTGKLEGAEAIYEGNQNNLVGLKTFEQKTPQHTVLFGMTGAGKSVHMQDILEQTQLFYSYTAIIEEGLSYERYTRNMGCQPFIVKADGEFTINYFDTQRLPLTLEQKSAAIVLVANMIGLCDNKMEYQLRRAQIAHYIDALYRDVFEDWSLKNQELLPEIKRLAYAVFKWKTLYMPAGSTFLEAFSLVTEGMRSGNDEICEFVIEIPEAAITRFVQDPATESYVLNTAYSYFRPEEFPQHAQLVDTMRYSTDSSHEKRKVQDLSTLLGAWTASGEYGRLFDGVSNLSLTGPVAHFELGSINENAPELKAACGLLITGFVRQHIISLPRSQRKRILFEEVARFLDVPGGDKIVREAYAQLRKFSCCATAIVQQYSQFKESAIRPVIMGNSKQFWIMKQLDRLDLEDLAQDIKLPNSAIDAIQQYPLPEHLPQEEKYSSICYYSPSSYPPLCGTLRNTSHLNA